MERLEDEPHGLRPHGGTTIFIQAGQIDAVDQHPAAGRQIQAGEQAEQGRFTRAGRPENGDSLSRTDLTLDPVENRQETFTAGNMLAQGLGLDGNRHTGIHFTSIMLFRTALIFMLLLPGKVLAAPVVLIFGDSLSASYGMPLAQSWPSLLQQRLTEKGFPHRVANASISGETTSGGLARINQALLDHKPALVVLELGANDGLRGLPVSEMRRNLASIIDACKRQGAKVLLVGMRIPPNYGQRYTNTFFESYATLAREHRLPLVPFMLEGVAGNRTLIQDDGLHPTAAAQPTILETLWSGLKPLLGKPVKSAAR